RHDPEAEAPVRGSLGPECNSRRAGSKRHERWLRVAGAFGKDLHGIAVDERLDCTAERVVVAMHLRGIVLLAINGQPTECAQERADEDLLEERRLGQGPRGPSRGEEYKQRIEQRVRMVGR